MKRLLSLVVLATGIVCLSWPIQTKAQKIKDFTGHEPTTTDLIEALKPRNTDAAQPRMRGIDLTGQPQEPRCEQYHQQVKNLTRGIDLTSGTAGVALTVTFAFNSAQLTPEATRTLDKLGEALQSTELASSCFQIEGHTDSIGSDSYNLGLSQRRAQSVVRYLTERYNLQDRTIPAGYGEQNPVASNDTPEGREKNRRVQVINVSAGN